MLGVSAHGREAVGASASRPASAGCARGCEERWISDESRRRGATYKILSGVPVRVPGFPIRATAAKLLWRQALPALCLAVAAWIVSPAAARSQGVGDLGVSPTRVVFEGRTRTAQVSLLNKGSQAATYRISVINMRMTETGKFETIETPDSGQNVANRFIRYAPRQITLEPGAAQTVRIMARKPKDLPPGEYRSHLYFRAVPSADLGRSVELADSADGIQIKLTVVPGVTIPLIVRHGELAARASLSDLSIREGGDPPRPELSFRVNRQGDRSLFGDVTASFFAAGSSKEQIVARANKLAVYTPNPSRLLVLPLRLPDGASLSGGRLHVLYRARPEEGGAIIAEAQMELP